MPASDQAAAIPDAPRFNVVVTSPGLAAPAVALLEGVGCALHYMPPYPPAAALADLAARVQADAILARQGQVTDLALAASPRLRIVARHGVGVDEVDLAAAAARGILVTRAPGSNTVAVAEHAIAMMLALAKTLKPLSGAVAAGAWRGPGAQVRDIAGLRLGLIGCGAIGQAVARFARGLGMVVTGHDPAAPQGAFSGMTRADSLASLLAGSDILSLHCPLSPATRHIIDATALARLPAGAIVINTARGGLIDEVALEAALESGQVAGAGLDVFEGEPPRPDHPLRRHPLVIVTPHVAGVTDASLVAMGVMAAECIVATLTGAEVPVERIVRG